MGIGLSLSFRPFFKLQVPALVKTVKTATLSALGRRVASLFRFQSGPDWNYAVDSTVV